jgi:hypothetical protein
MRSKHQQTPFPYGRPDRVIGLEVKQVISNEHASQTVPQQHCAAATQTWDKLAY